MEKAFITRLFSDDLKAQETLKLQSRSNATIDAHGYALIIANTPVHPFAAFVLEGCTHVGVFVCVFYIRRGVKVARSDYNGQFLGPQIVERATDTVSTLFLYYWYISRFFLSEKETAGAIIDFYEGKTCYTAACYDGHEHYSPVTFCGGLVRHVLFADQKIVNIQDY